MALHNSTLAIFQADNCFKKPFAPFDKVALCVEYYDLPISDTQLDQQNSQQHYGMWFCLVIRDNVNFRGCRLFEREKSIIKNIDSMLEIDPILQNAERLRLHLSDSDTATTAEKATVAVTSNRHNYDNR